MNWPLVSIKIKHFIIKQEKDPEKAEPRQKTHVLVHVVKTGDPVFSQSLMEVVELVIT